MFYVKTKVNKNAKICWRSVVACVNNFRNIAGCSLIFLNHVPAQGRPLVRCLAGYGDPEGTEHGWVIWSRPSHRQPQTDQSCLKTVAYCVLFLLRHECEGFSINMLHRVLWSRCDKQRARCVSWVVSQSPTSGNPAVSDLMWRHMWTWLTQHAYNVAHIQYIVP